MSGEYTCPTDGCGTSVVLVNGGGVHRTLICSEHNEELQYDGRVETEWVGDENPQNDYQVVEEDV